MYWLLLVPGITYVLYKGYKRLLGPAYQPGYVSKLAEKYPERFDPPGLYEESTNSTWQMPEGITIHYMKTPSEATDSSAVHVVCVSGGPGVANAKPWELCQIPELTTNATFYTYHVRGAGKSSKPIDKFPAKRIYNGVSKVEQTLGLTQQVADIERIRRRIGKDRIALIGHSFGGFIASLYAAEFPQHVASLVLLAPATVLKVPNPEGDLFEIIRSRLESEDEKAAYDDFKRRYFDFTVLVSKDEKAMQEQQKEFLEWYCKADENFANVRERQQNEVGGWTAFASFVSLGMEADFQPQLKKRLQHANFKTIVVTGTEDLMNPTIRRIYASLFPPDMVDCKEIEGGHFLAVEKPHELASAIRDTLFYYPKDST